MTNTFSSLSGWVIAVHLTELLPAEMSGSVLQEVLLSAVVQLKLLQDWAVCLY